MSDPNSLPDSLDEDGSESDSAPPGDTGEYDQMLAQLDGAISEITDKIESGRVRSPEKDKVRVQYYRTLGYMMRTKRQILEDKTLEELAAEIEELREAQEQDGSDFKL